MRASALVLGGGIVGMNIALALQEADYQVTVLDPPKAMPSASWGNAGRIATELVAPLASLDSIRRLPGDLFCRGGAAAFPPRALRHWLPFGLRLMASATPRHFATGRAALRALMAEALPAWRRRVELIGAPELLVETGHLTIWENERTAAAGRAAWYAADIGTATVREASVEEMRRLATLLTVPPTAALYFGGSAQVRDPTDLADRLAAAFIARGGAIEPIASDLASATRRGKDVLVAAAGVASADILAPAGHKVPMIAERGYHIEAPGAPWPDELPSLFFEDRSLVVTGFRRSVRATSFVEFTTATSPPDPAKWERLIAHTQALGLPFDDDSRRWMGARPTLPDYLPAIGRSRSIPNLYYAFGHQHLGLTLAAITGELVADLARGRLPVVALAPFDLARFERRSQ